MLVGEHEWQRCGHRLDPLARQIFGERAVALHGAARDPASEIGLDGAELEPHERWHGVDGGLEVENELLGIIGETVANLLDECFEAVDVVRVGPPSVLPLDHRPHAYAQPVVTTLAHGVRQAVDDVGSHREIDGQPTFLEEGEHSRGELRVREQLVPDGMRGGHVQP